jgi:hypothetical protein
MECVEAKESASPHTRTMLRDSFNGCSRDLTDRSSRRRASDITFALSLHTPDKPNTHTHNPTCGRRKKLQHTVIQWNWHRPMSEDPVEAMPAREDCCTCMLPRPVCDRVHSSYLFSVLLLATARDCRANSPSAFASFAFSAMTSLRASCSADADASTSPKARLALTHIDGGKGE